jgi:hypothetical protein
LGFFGRKIGVDYQHPEQYYDGWITPEEHFRILDEEKASSLDVKLRRRHLPFDAEDQDTELCYNCGLTVGQLVYTGYCSRLRVQHTRDNQAIWSLGSKWLLRDQPVRLIGFYEPIS